MFQAKEHTSRITCSPLSIRNQRQTPSLARGILSINPAYSLRSPDCWSRQPRSTDQSRNARRELSAPSELRALTPKPTAELSLLRPSRRLFFFSPYNPGPCQCGSMVLLIPLVPQAKNLTLSFYLSVHCRSFRG